MSADGLADRERRQHLMDARIEYVVPASFSSASQFRGYSPIRAQPFQTSKFWILDSVFRQTTHYLGAAMRFPNSATRISVAMAKPSIRLALGNGLQL